MRLNADQLRKGEGLRGKGEVLKKLKRNDIYIILDNVLDTYNIGSIFRLADAVAAKKVIICGASETPFRGLVTSGCSRGQGELFTKYKKVYLI